MLSKTWWNKKTDVLRESPDGVMDIMSFAYTCKSFYNHQGQEKNVSGPLSVTLVYFPAHTWTIFMKEH